mgnify:CR=1 FL=1|tara:strand:+ start:249 stop:632 length:384 start_codon:yes stop_codon:yes gene_type:complete
MLSEQTLLTALKTTLSPDIDFPFYIAHEDGTKSNEKSVTISPESIENFTEGIVDVFEIEIMVRLEAHYEKINVADVDSAWTTIVERLQDLDASTLGVLRVWITSMEDSVEDDRYVREATIGIIAPIT